MDRIILKAEDIKDKIIAGIDFIVNPVVSTLGPKGNNVMFEDGSLQHILTNDGVTIAKNIQSKDQIIQSIVKMIQGAALKTNAEAGDGTTTTTLLAGLLTKEAIKLSENGYSWVEIRDTLNTLKDSLTKRIEKMKIKVVNKNGLREIATISANNDPVVADYVMQAIDTAGEDGMIFLGANNKVGTEVEKELGFMVKAGVMYQELLTDSGKNAVMFKEAPVLLTDKKIYYAEEAETILREAVKMGAKSVVVVARDFMGEAINTFITNHTKGVISVMLVKAEVDEKNNERLKDLAIYLGGHILSEKTGSLVNKVKPTDFVIVNQVFSDPTKTLFTPKVTATKELKARIKLLKEELDKDKNNEEVKARLASLTTGVVTLKVGGATPIETREMVFRYEDAVHATRSAMKYGYLVGGGTALLKAYDPSDCPNKDFLPLYRRYCESILRQIVDNAGGHSDTVVQTVVSNKGQNYGYNALTGKYEDLLKAGVVDPFMVIKLAIENSVSVANMICSIRYYMINDVSEEDTDKE